MEEGDLIFEIHHGGRFKNSNGFIYVGGDISIHDEGYDRDCMSFIEVESILKSYGYKRGDLVYYKQVGMNLDEGLVRIKIDPDVLKMVDCHKGVESVVLYTVSQDIDSDCIPFTHNLPECKKVGHNSKTCPSKKDKGIVSTNAKKTPTTNKKQGVGGARATVASAVDSRARGVRIAAASDVDSRVGGSRFVATSAVDSRAGGSRAVAASSTGVRTSTAPLTIYGGGANSERVVVPTLEKAIQRMQAKKKKKPWV